MDTRWVGFGRASAVAAGTAAVGAQVHLNPTLRWMRHPRVERLGVGIAGALVEIAEGSKVTLEKVQMSWTQRHTGPLAGHATCAIKVTFRPTSRGLKSAAINVNGGGGGLRSVKLSGNGL